MPFDKWVEYLQLKGGTWSLEIEKISTETENVSVLRPLFDNKHHCKYWYRIMYATVILSYFTYVERHADIISARTSSETLFKRYLSIFWAEALFILSFAFPPIKPNHRAGLSRWQLFPHYVLVLKPVRNNSAFHPVSSTGTGAELMYPST